MSEPQNTPLYVYKNLLAEGKLNKDSGQSSVINELNILYFSILNNVKTKWKFWASSATPKGLYLFGGVGRGKTMLMDLFFAACPDQEKQRLHFHDFMVQAHNLINQARKENAEEPIETAAERIMQNGRLVCFDEMEVRDIADAMIINRLFVSLWQRGMILVSTSNRHPDELYKNGLHRDRFMPFIDELKSKVRIVNIQKGDDFRKRLLAGTDGWLFPFDEQTKIKLSLLFRKFLQERLPQEETVNSTGREIIFPKTGSDIAFVYFNELCCSALAAGDFLMIADRFKGLIMLDVPILGNDQRDAARRFMWLVDALYDRGRFLVVGAAVEKEKIYVGEDWQFEFNRTLSRLTQMSRHHLSE